MEEEEEEAWPRPCPNSWCRQPGRTYALQHHLNQHVAHCHCYMPPEGHPATSIEAASEAASSSSNDGGDHAGDDDMFVDEDEDNGGGWGDGGGGWGDGGGGDADDSDGTEEGSEPDFEGEDAVEEGEEEEGAGAEAHAWMDDGGGEHAAGLYTDVVTPATLAMLQFTKLVTDLDLGDKAADDLLGFLKLPQAGMLPCSMRTIRKHLRLCPRDVKQQIKTARVDVPAKAQQVLGAPAELSVVYRPVMQLALRAIQHSVFASDLANLQFEAELGADKLGDFCTGSWWAKEQQQQRQRLRALDRREATTTTLMPLLVHSDKTHLDEKGRTTAHPVTLAVGNFRNRVLRRTCARELVALLPALDITTAQSKSGGKQMVAAKRAIFHSAMAVVLASVGEAYERGVVLEIHGVKRRFIPIVMGLCADAEEALRIALVKPSCRTRCPCFLCHCPRADMADETYDISSGRGYRIAGDIYGVYDILKDNPTAADKKLALQVLEVVSIVDLVRDCGYRSVPFGISRRGGKFGALIVDLLHQYDLGLCEDCIRWTVKLIEQHGGDDAKGTLDRLFMALRPSHNSDRDSFSISSFPRGITNLSRVMGQEYPSMVLQLQAIVMADEKHVLLPEESRLPVAQALDRVYRLRLWLGQEELDRKPLEDGTFDAAVKEVMVLVKAAFAGLSDSSFRYLKFHLLLHYKEMLLSYGSLISLTTHPWEAALRFLVKGPYRRSNRQRGAGGEGLALQLTADSIAAAEVGLGLALYEQPELRAQLCSHFDPAIFPEAGPYPSYYQRIGRAAFFTPRPVPSRQRHRRRSKAASQQPFLITRRDGEPEGADVDLWFLPGGHAGTAAALPEAERDAVREFVCVMHARVVFDLKLNVLFVRPHQPHPPADHRRAGRGRGGRRRRAVLGAQGGARRGERRRGHLPLRRRLPRGGRTLARLLCL